ncbi:MAG: hypothetical protein ACI9BN_001540, partial [Francisella sp.]
MKVQTNLLSDANSLYLSNGVRIELNTQQLEALTHIKQFLKST